MGMSEVAYGQYVTDLIHFSIEPKASGELDLGRMNDDILNRLAEITSESSSCDEGIDTIQHPWGYGCGSCDGCVARWRAWDEYVKNLGQGP